MTGIFSLRAFTPRPAATASSCSLNRLLSNKVNFEAPARRRAVAVFLEAFYGRHQAALGLSNQPAGDHIIELFLSINIDNNRGD